LSSHFMSLTALEVAPQLVAVLNMTRNWKTIFSVSSRDRARSSSHEQ